MKNFHLTKIPKIGCSIGLILLIVILTYSLYMNVTKCKKIEGGWTCGVSRHDRYFSCIPFICNFELFRNALLDLQCRLQGSKYIEEYPYFVCKRPFDDAGKVCKNSNECQGKCIYTKGTNYPEPLCNKEMNCEGECAQFNLDRCRLWIVVVDGELKPAPETGFLCD